MLISVNICDIMFLTLWTVTGIRQRKNPKSEVIKMAYRTFSFTLFRTAGRIVFRQAGRAAPA
jgi:hypothetical protein